MNWDPNSETWNQAKGQLKQKWGGLTDDDLDVVEGKKDVLIGKNQEGYGCSNEGAETPLKISPATHRMRTNNLETFFLHEFKDLYSVERQARKPRAEHYKALVTGPPVSTALLWLRRCC